MKLVRTILVIGLGVVLSGCFHTPQTGNSGPLSQVPTAGEKQQQNTQTQVQDLSPAGAQKQTTTTGDGYSGRIIAGSSAPLLEFVQSDYEKAIGSDKLVFLYFYASWCPICRRETADALYPAFNELTSDQVVGFRVNFKDNDTDSDETALAKQLDVPYQHHKILIKNGQILTRSPQAWDKDRYLQERNNFL